MPINIFNGKPTIKTFICGIVLDIKPSVIFVKNKARVAGPAILKAIINILKKREDIFDIVISEKVIDVKGAK